MIVARKNDFRKLSGAPALASTLIPNTRFPGVAPRNTRLSNTAKYPVEIK